MGIFDFLKPKPKEQNISSKPIEVEQKSKLMDIEFFEKTQKEKKTLLPSNTMTREEILKEIEKQYFKSNLKNDNPFKTKEDVYYNFFSPEMELVRANVPFEEINVAGKKFYMNIKYQNGKISVEELYPKPDLEIDLKNEFAKKETTKKQLQKINEYLLYINNEKAKGNEKYNLIDIEDLKAEKYRLERILSSIKYGKEAIFRFQSPYNGKPTYFLKYCNGEYKYLKTTEHNFLTEENSVKSIKGQTIIQKVTEILNLRITQSWGDILKGIMWLILFFGSLWVLWNMGTFEERLFDERVQTFCGESLKLSQDQLIQMRDYSCSLSGINITNVLNNQQSIQNYNIPK